MLLLRCQVTSDWPASFSSLQEEERCQQFDPKHPNLAHLETTCCIKFDSGETLVLPHSILTSRYFTCFVMTFKSESFKIMREMCVAFWVVANRCLSIGTQKCPILFPSVSQSFYLSPQQFLPQIETWTVNIPKFLQKPSLLIPGDIPCS